MIWPTSPAVSIVTPFSINAASTARKAVRLLPAP